MEKTFQPKKGGPAAKKKATFKVSAPSTAGAGAKSAAGMTENSAAQQVDALAEKKKVRLAELEQTYALARALPFTMAVVLKLNYVPPPPPVEVEPEVVEEVAAKGAKGKAPAKKK